MSNTLSDIPFRPVDFLPVNLDVKRRDDGSVILRSLNPMDTPAPNVVAPLKQWAEEAGDRIWLAERPAGPTQKGVWREISYQQAWQQVQVIASQLLTRGLNQEAPLMVLSGNSIEHALISYAAMLAAAPVSPISPAYSLMSSDFARLKYVYQLIKPKIIFVQDYAMFAKALEQLDLDGVEVIAVNNSSNRACDYADLLQPADMVAVEKSYQRLHWDMVAKYLFTSGSTGMPKAVINLHRALCVNMAMGRKLIVEKPDDPPPVSVSWLPWNHIYGSNAILHLVLVMGGTLYLDRGRPLPGHFDETILALKEIAPTAYSNVPIAYAMLADALEQDDEMAALFFSRLRNLAYGGAALGQDLADRIQRIAVKTTGERILFTTGYGATETGPTIMSVHWETEQMGLLGLPLPGVDIKLAPVGSKMEVRVRGDCITPGYYKNPEKTSAAFDEEGFYCLGDGAKFVDENDPTQGLVFDGRIVEDFKLSSGTWVNAGRLRVNIIDAADGMLRDCVIAGLDQEYISVLGFPDLAVLAKIAGEKLADEALLNHPAVREQLAQHLAAYNEKNRGSSTKVRRVLLLATPPVADNGEITDKGYINQSAVLSARAAEVARLYTPSVDPDIIVI